MHELFNLSDDVAIVTGAGRGIGEGIATTLADAGAAVVCAARRLDEIERVAAGIRARGGKAIAVATDVTTTAPSRRSPPQRRASSVTSKSVAPQPLHRRSARPHRPVLPLVSDAQRPGDHRPHPASAHHCTCQQQADPNGQAANTIGCRRSRLK